MHQRSFAILAALLFCAALCAYSQAPVLPAPQTPSYTATAAQGVFFVKIRQGIAFYPEGAGTGLASLDSYFQSIRVSSVESMLENNRMLRKALSEEEESLSRLLKVYYDAPVDPFSIVSDLAENAQLEYAEPYYTFPVMQSPNDPMLAQQAAISSMKMSQAWDITTGDSSIVIGDVDSGVEWTHPDLAANIYINPGEWGTSGELSNNGSDDDGNGKIDDYHGWDFIGNGSASNPQPDNNPMDVAFSHGTMTSGCFSAVTNNGVGVAGTSYRSKVLAIKAGGSSGQSIISGYDAIRYAADMGCKIINCSWGGSAPAYVQSLQDVIDYAYSKGALVVASAGNDPVNNDYYPRYPSSLRHVLNVSATETNGSAAQWSTYGGSVQVHAPGTRILTTQVGETYTTPADIQGTSFSAPYVAGIAALLMSVHKDWTPDQIAKQLRVTMDHFSASKPSPLRFGRVNAYKALSLNATLSDIPGLRVSSFAYSIPGNSKFTEPGQTARVDVVFQNVLAPTSASAQIQLEWDGKDLIADSVTFPIGVMATGESRSISLNVTLTDTGRISEPNLVLRFKFTDGEHLDYMIERIPIQHQNGWRLANETQQFPPYTSLDVVGENQIWGVLSQQYSDSYTYSVHQRSTDNGAGWNDPMTTYQGFPRNQLVKCIKGVDRTTAFVGTSPTDGNAGIYRTTNSGVAWSGTSISPITSAVNWIYMFDAGRGVFQGNPKNGFWGIGKTQDSGKTWTALAAPLAAAANEGGWQNCYDFVGNTGWFGTNNRVIYKTEDGGDTWTAIPVTGSIATDISFRDAQTGVIAFTRQNDPITGSNRGENALAITHDGGATWTPISTLTLNSQTQALMERAGRRLWVLTSGNAFVSEDDGATWTAQAAPPDFNATVSDIYTSSKTNPYTDLFAAGRSADGYFVRVYRIRSLFEAPAAAERAPSDYGFTLGEAYPNPATTTQTRVDLSLPTAGRFILELYDYSGRRMQSVMDAVLAPGSHSAGVNLAGLPAGRYLLRASFGNSAQTRALVVMR